MPTYNDKYQAGWSGKETAGTLTIATNYQGAIIPITLLNDSVFVSYMGDGWEEHIIGLNAEFEIQNDKPDYFDLIELMTGTERQYKVTIEQTSPASIVLFEGFLNTDSTSQKYLKYQSISLVASSFVSKLKYVYADIIETLESRTFIDVIIDILNETGTLSNVRVNSRLYAQDDTLLEGQTFFNKNGVFTELFWKDNVEREDGLVILDKILRSFNCYMYCWEGYWWIERYGDLYINPVPWVEYDRTETYAPDETGTEVSIVKSLTNVHDVLYTGRSQTQTIMPGNKEIRVMLEDLLFLNLTINDFSGTTQSIPGTTPAPGVRQWVRDSRFNWSLGGRTYKNISNGIARTGLATDWETEQFTQIGLSTRVKVTITASTQMEFSFKFATVKGTFGPWTGDWADYTFRFHYYLSDYPSTSYIMYNDSSDEWELVSSTPGGAIQSIDIPGNNFSDANSAVDVSVNIPLGEVVGLSGDTDLVFCIGTETVFVEGGPQTTCLAAGIGDAFITASGDFQDNVISGDANSDFLNRLDIDTSIFDMESVNYKNAIFRDNILNTRTVEWTINGVDYMPLSDWLLTENFQLWNVSRQKITGAVKRSLWMRPLQKFYDGKQSNKPFILTSFRYNLTAEMYEDFELSEYDNSTEITLIG